MRSDKTIVVLNGIPWLLDFRRGRLSKLDANLARHQPALKGAFCEFDWLSSLIERLRLVEYADYSDEGSVEEADWEQNLRNHESGRQPGVRIFYEREISRIELHRDRSELPADLAVVASMLQYSFRSIDIRKFLSDTVLLKCNPSVGARHGIDVVVVKAGFEFYYDCIDHSLVRLGSVPEALHEGTIFLLLLRPEVYSWRYPQSSVIFDVYLDLGHALGNIATVADVLGLEINFVDDVIFPQHESLRGLTPLLALRFDTLNPSP